MHEESKASKFIVFKVADYLLGLPIGDVLKVVKCSSLASKGLKTMGLVQLGKHMIRVLDLHEQLSADDASQVSGKQPFLVIARGQEGELCGISVDEPPNLVELPLETMRSLPQSDRHGKRALEMVSHAAILSEKDVTTTIFLLDVKRAVNSA